MGLLAALSALFGLLLLTLGLIGVLGVATPNMQGFNAGQSVVISDGGMSVYSRSDTRAGTVCVGEGEGSGGQVVFERPVEQYAVDVTGTEFYEIARSPEDLASGTYTVTCNGTTESVYAGPWAPDTTSSGVLGPGGLVAGALLLALAVALLVLAVVLRGRRTSTAGQGHSYDQGGRHGGQPGWQGSSAYSSPYATPPQPAPPYEAPPAPGGASDPQGYQGGASDPQGYPYGAPTPPPAGAGDPYRQQPYGEQQPEGWAQPSSYGQHKAETFPDEADRDATDGGTAEAQDERGQGDDDWPPPPPR